MSIIVQISQEHSQSMENLLHVRKRFMIWYYPHKDLIIEKAAPGMTLRELNQMVIDHYAARLDELGLAKDGKTVADYYYHGVSHQLGLDTHDISCSDYEVLEPGMVITVEPGFYIEEEEMESALRMIF